MGFQINSHHISERDGSSQYYHMSLLNSITGLATLKILNGRIMDYLKKKL